MGDAELESAQTFPSYAELTQTRAWRKHDAPVTADTDEVTRAIEVSRNSRYAEGELLGTGGMGKVLLARDARIGRDVALKVLHPERELDPYDRARFLREAQVQGQLEHPSIVPVYDVERRPDGTTFFTMRRVLGRTLSSIIDELKRGVPSAKMRYTRRELLTAFATVCLAVDYAHSRGVVHRDLKPANIMLGDFGEVYVLDWGLARLVDESGETAPSTEGRLSIAGTLLGTPLYMAPEQMSDPAVGPPADVFSLGAILYELLTFERVRDASAIYVPVDARCSARVPDANVPPELETMCVKATALEEQDRYPSARALHEALARYLDGDRELAQRRQLAAKHVDAAQLALASGAGEAERGIAMTELTRAVALDPRNEETVAMLAHVLAEPPQQMPAAVEDAYEKEKSRIVRMGAKQSLLAMATWVLSIPVLLAAGVGDASQIALLVAPLVLTIAVQVLVFGRETNTYLQYAGITIIMIGGAMVSRLYGPFVLAPLIIATNAVVLQAHPVRKMQRFGLVAALVAMTGAVAIEYLGVLPRSYVFSDGTWTIVPQLVQLPHELTIAFVTVATLASIVFPCQLIARVRNELTDEQIKRASQAWQFKQLGARLVARDVG